MRPQTHGGRIDILVAAQSGEAVRHGDDNGRQGAVLDHPVKPLGQVLAEILPGGMARARTGKARQIDKKRKSLAIMAMGHVDDDLALCRIAQEIGCQQGACDREAVKTSLGVSWRLRMMASCDWHMGLRACLWARRAEGANQPFVQPDRSGLFLWKDAREGV
ncbi:hypothetical protein V6L77_24630 [Pannonibacter sp. Pt2-lr]